MANTPSYQILRGLLHKAGDGRATFVGESLAGERFVRGREDGSRGRSGVRHGSGAGDREAGEEFFS